MPAFANFCLASVFPRDRDGRTVGLGQRSCPAAPFSRALRCRDRPLRSSGAVPEKITCMTPFLKRWKSWLQTPEGIRDAKVKGNASGKYLKTDRDRSRALLPFLPPLAFALFPWTDEWMIGLRQVPEIHRLISTTKSLYIDRYGPLPYAHTLSHQ